MFCVSSNDTNEAGFCDVVGVNHCNGIIKRRDFINAKFHTIPDTDYCSAGGRVLWVILVDQLLKAYVYDVSKQLSVFVGLIITNCIVMGRLEAFAMGNKPWPSFLDGLGNGVGYGLILNDISVLPGIAWVVDHSSVSKYSNQWACIIKAMV